VEITGSEFDAQRNGMTDGRPAVSRICVVRQFYYPSDPRVRREAEALASDGHEVDVICLRKDGETARDKCNGVNVYRLPLSHSRGSTGRYLYEYAAFFVLAFMRLMTLFARKRYDIIHVNTMPDFLVFVAAVCKLFGARVVLDMHECVPELYQTKYGLPPGHPFIRLLARVEQWSMAFADQVITCTQQQKDVFVRRGTPASKIAVVLNSADTSIFTPPNGGPMLWTPGDDLVLISHGLVVERYGLDTIVRAVDLLRRQIPGIRLRVLGSGEYLPALQALVRELDVEEHVWLAGYVPESEMIEAIRTAHIGVVAVKRDAFRDLTHTNKMYECVVMRKPVVIAETAAVRAYFDESCFEFFVSDDPVDLARSILALYHHPERAQSMVEHASRQYRDYAWDAQKEIYRRAVLGAAPGHQPAMLDAEQAA